VETWQYAVEVFNELAADWKQTAETISRMWQTPINANFDLPVFKQLLKERFGTLENFIKMFFIQSDPEYAKFSKRIKIEETLKHTEFPDLSGLMATLQKVKDFAIKKIAPAEFEKYITQIWDGNGFVLTAAIAEDTEKEFTFYTANSRENLVLEIATQLANSFNLLNSLGASIYPRDLPPVIGELLTSANTEKRKGDLNYYFGDGDHLIQQITTGYQIKNKVLVYHLMQNLTDKEVEVLYEQLTGTKNT